ncbi:hypothetical protein CCHL11_06392 [Colletotrichum chlorophyti]|uniref:RING finger domain-containing protein n=1 Tax=Colletotrichum chlorophyti TaxID=708187 RepID=A0A1Q8RPY4_9PEZI|nr:hypothetical protein CCHL11_06392 [Colletotrichum chlorophyti]
MAMAMRQNDVDDVPPPPYSETDIYSNSGRHSNPSSNSPRNPPRHIADDASSRVSSHASSQSEVIFTPPLTPRTSGGPFHHHETTTSSVPPSAYSTFAATYFDSRPPPALPPREQIVHALTLNPTSTPDDVPYSPAWAPRDVTPQDWATFTNCLIPHHSAARNEAVINRKLQAEEEAVAAAAAAAAATSNGGGVSSSISGRSNSSTHASAQLDQIRSDPDSDPAAVVGLRREDAETVIAQWNQGFFRPRGILIRLNPEVEDPRMPGAWDRSFDRHTDSPTAGGGPTPMPFPVQAQAPITGPGVPIQQPQPQVQPPIPNDSRSWSFGGIRVTTDGISIGDTFVADSNGIRVGSLIADENGIRFGNNTNPRAQPHYAGPHVNWHPPMAPPPGPVYAPPPFPPPPHPQPPRHPGHHEHPFFQAAHTRHGSAGRGRPPGRYPSGHRSSSTSSASSTSSTSSASSVGSLPEYEDLYPTQLPIYKQRVAAWLSNPDEPVTKADVAQLRAEIRSASRAAATEAREGDSTVDEKALKAELKALTQEWRKLKRQQRALRKERRREKQKLKVEADAEFARELAAEDRKGSGPGW